MTLGAENVNFYQIFGYVCNLSNKHLKDEMKAAVTEKET